MARLIILRMTVVGTFDVLGRYMGPSSGVPTELRVPDAGPIPWEWPLPRAREHVRIDLAINHALPGETACNY
jgi:hypothetical protein